MIRKMIMTFIFNKDNPMKLTAALLLLLASLLSNILADETVTIAVTGRVVDQNGAAVVGAKLSAERLGSTIRTDLVTNNEGGFSADLARGSYVIRVDATGFEPYTRKVEITSTTREIDALVLSVAAATAVVTVSDDAEYAITDVSTATKTFTAMRDIPQSITVVKREQIADQNATSVADIVRYVPGVTMHQGENNRDEVIIRGNKSNADFYLDGVRDDVQYYRDPYNMERFEALKGPNAMIFGRGGGGGVVNRVTKDARFSKTREFTLTGGSFSDRRVTGDVGQAITSRLALRLNSLYEGSRTFRRHVTLEREGINPTLAFAPDSKTSINISYEFFRDRRVADRGITSFNNRPANVPIDTYYGDPGQSFVRASVNLFTASVERMFGEVIFRNRTHVAAYDRGYQNFVPGSVNAAGTLVSLSAYNNATQRTNLFNQTDATFSFSTGRVRHTAVGGTEFGRQLTDNLRKTGYFNNAATSLQVTFENPTTNVPVTFRQSATDADNHLRLNLGAAFAQDQIELARWLQVIAGVRYDHFGLTYLNNRNGQTLSRVDRLVSPRFGVVIKPITPLSIYGSYSVSFLPSSGDQFSSLTTITQQVKPEKFTNYEAGVKWDVRKGLFLTSAVYRLDRTNTRATDPNDPTRIIQTGSQRTNGFEASLTGNVTRSWSMTGGYSWQDARITSSTTAAAAGKQVAQVPHDMLSLWNKCEFTSRLSAGLGISYRSDMFAAADNTVVLPSYLIANGAVFYKISERWRIQANVDNLTGRRYFKNADNNTNISPGAPRSIKIGVIARF